MDDMERRRAGLECVVYITRVALSAALSRKAGHPELDAADWRKLAAIMYSGLTEESIVYHGDKTPEEIERMILDAAISSLRLN